MVRRWLLLLLLSLIVGCVPREAPADIQILPTFAPSPTAPVNLEAAHRVAELYLSAWQRRDYPAMYALLSFHSQEATPYAEFERFYSDAEGTMTLESLNYRGNTLVRSGDRLATFNYDVTFQTDILGDFTDKGRDLNLVLDAQAADWRVAWSLGDILPEMGRGARLEFEPRVPSRAEIYDRHGMILADQNGIVAEVNVIPENIPNREACLNDLAEALNREVETIVDTLNRAGSTWIVPVGYLEPPAYARLHQDLRDDCDASFRQRATRQYLRGELMPHVIGHVGYPDADEIPGLIAQGFNQETIIGKSGIERSWNDTLNGRPGGRLSVISANGTRLRTLAEASSTVPQSLWLTIDAQLQEYVLRTLGEAYVENQAGWGGLSRGAAAVVMDVNTGELLALATWPTFNNNALNPFPAIGRETANAILDDLNDNPRLPQLNRATQGEYPAGSTMKVVDALAVLDSGLYEPNTNIFCSGVWQQGNDRRFDWLAGGHGRMNARDALKNSCNPFFYEAGYRLNQEDPFLLPNYAREFGLGSATGLGDLAEAEGLIIDPEWLRINTGQPWTFSYAVSMAIGQGELAVTPLQMARLYAGIANGGQLLRPQLVRETGILDQRTFVAQPEVMRQWDLAPIAYDEVRDGLCAVTSENYGTAEHIFRRSPLQEIGVCGKTGTAQTPGDQPPHSWFIAWGPREEPEIVVALIVENAGEGSAVAAPLVRRIMEYYFFGPFD